MKIKIFLYGNEIQEIKLEPGIEYIAGRSEECQIILKGQKGISRQHIKFYDVDGQWCAELLARYGSLLHNNEEVSNVALEDNETFSAPPFEFKFITRESKKAAEDNKTEIVPLDPNYSDSFKQDNKQPGALAPVPAGNNSPVPIGGDFGGDNEVTDPGIVNLTTF